MKRLIILFLFATITSCTVTFVLPDQELKPVGDATLPDIETILDEDPERGGRIEGDSIPEAYGNKKVDDLPYLPTIADSIEFLTIHGTTGAKEWKRFTALTTKNYIGGSLGAGHVIADEGTGVTFRDTLDFAGAGVTVTDGGTKTLVTITAGGDVTTAQLADSTAAVRADFPSGGGASELSDLSDVNTSTPTNRNVLIADGIDFESRALVEADISDLSHTVDTDTNIDSAGVVALGFVAGAHTIDTDTNIDSAGIATLGYVAGAHTIDTDTNIDSAGVVALGFVAGAHTTNTDAQTLSFSNPDLTISGGNSVDLSALTAKLFRAVQAVTPPTDSTITIDFDSYYVGIFQIDMTTASTVSTIVLTPSNPVNGGVYTFHFQNTGSTNSLDFPATFLDQAGAAFDGGTTYDIDAADVFFTCYYDGTNYNCK